MLKLKRDDMDMIFFAFRYALGRKTGAPSMVRDYLFTHWGLLDKTTKENIKHEIVHAINMGLAGMECDVKTWEEVLTY
jgi:hypothetical protein